MKKTNKKAGFKSNSHLYETNVNLATIVYNNQCCAKKNVTFLFASPGSLMISRRTSIKIVYVHVKYLADRQFHYREQKRRFIKYIASTEN